MAEPIDSLDRFRGQPWSNWTDFLGRESPVSDEDDPERPEPDCMRLPREDMGLFGLCPETESFYVIICELCQACVKPQGLANHYDKWHKSETDALPPPELPEKNSNSKSGSSKGGTPNKLNVSNAKLKVKRSVTVVSNKAGRAASSIEEEVVLSLPPSSDAEKIVITHVDTGTNSNVTSRPAGHTSASSGTTPTALLQPVVALTPLGSPSRACNSPPTVVKLTHVTVTPSAALKSTHISGTSTANVKTTHASNSSSTSAKSICASASSSSNLPNMVINSSSSFSSPIPAKKRLKVERKCLPVKEREYDPDKHCGVWNGENSKPCTRSLTCKSHTLSMRRAVSGRSKHFDKLLADHKAAKDAAMKALRPSSAHPSCQSSPMEVDSSQTLSPPPPGRVGGNIQLDVPASPLPTSLSTPMSSSGITPNSTPLANSAPNHSATIAPYLGTLASTPLPSLPDLTEDSFETHSVPVLGSKASLLTGSSISKDPLGVGHSPEPSQPSGSITACMQSPSMTSIQSTTSATNASASAQSSLPPQAPATSSVSMEVGFIIPTPIPATVPASTQPITTTTVTTSATVPLAISIPKTILTPTPVISHSFHSNGTTVQAHTVAAVQMCDFQTLFEDVTWLKHHPRPLAVCTFGARKVGALICNSRKYDVVREGLRAALTNSPGRSPHNNDFYGNVSTAITGGALRPVLTNICAKGNYLSPSGKILIPTIGLPKSHKLPLVSNPLHGSSVSSSSLGVPSALKAVLPKPQQLTVKAAIGQNMANKDNIKNGQFHVPNILSGSLKRHAETCKSGGNVNSKRIKRKHTQNVNPAEIIGSLLARKNSRIAGRGNHMPLVTVAIANGLGGSTTSAQSDSNDPKNVRSSVGTDSLRTELPKGLSSTNGTPATEGTASATNVKAVSPNVQNVRIATAPSTVQLATPQITYLTTGPVTFQQIPVLSPQVISQIQLQSKGSGSGQSIPLKLLSGSGGVSLATATAATTTRTMVLHQDKDHGSSES